ncbi:MAG: hypothetical protein ACLVJ6_05670 [Merdibacter sp.]
MADYELRVFGVHYDAQEDTHYAVIYPDGSKSSSPFALERKTLKKKRGHGLFVPEGKIIETFEARIPQRVLTFSTTSRPNWAIRCSCGRGSD